MVNVPSFCPNPDFPQLCDKVTVGWDIERGRFVKALEDIPIGTVVCVEEGITVNVDPQKCYRCLETTGDAEFAYCEHCKEFYEPAELACGEFDELGIFKLAAHLVFSFPFSDIAELVQNEDPIVPECAPSSLSTSDISAVFQLTPFPEIGESFKAKPVQEAIQRILIALEKDVNWGRLKYPARLVAFTKSLRIMAERCAKNAHTIYSIEQKESEEEIPIGTGLFPIASIFNHSCTPNVFAFFIRNTFIFVSRGVRAGEELVDSYGVTYQQHTLKQRTEFLASVSGFKCHCLMCIQNKSNDEHLEKNFNDVYRCAREASCLLDISEYSEFMKPGTKDLETLIVAFASRWDAEVYSQKTFELWKQFVENAKVRGIVHDPYLVRPYVEMTLLAWSEEVEVSEEEKTSLLIVTQRLLNNFFAGLHPLSEPVKYFVYVVQKKQNVYSVLERLKMRARSLWPIEEMNLS